MRIETPCFEYLASSNPPDIEVDVLLWLNSCVLHQLDICKENRTGAHAKRNGRFQTLLEDLSQEVSLGQV